MGLRTFTDSDGRVWEVWDVIPHAIVGDADKRRRGERRADQTAPSAFDRRQAERRATLSPAMADGWLAFRCGEERRRLAPIPEGWEMAGDPQLRDYCRDARVVGTAPMQIIARTLTESGSK